VLKRGLPARQQRNREPGRAKPFAEKAHAPAAARRT
jgi:hypothetical protein